MLAYYLIPFDTFPYFWAPPGTGPGPKMAGARAGPAEVIRCKSVEGVCNPFPISSTWSPDEVDAESGRDLIYFIREPQYHINI